MAPRLPALVGLVALIAAVACALDPAQAVRVLLEPEAEPLTGPLLAALSLLVHAVAAWLLVVAGLTLAARAPAGAGRVCRALLHRCAPAGVRRAVALALGTGLALGLPGPVSAAEPASTSARTHATATAAAPPDAGATAPAPLDWPGLSPKGRGDAKAPSRAARVREPVVVVQPGDTLWDLAARSIPAPVTNAARAAEWPRWWSANRDVVGDDPDLLLPGQRLVAPPAR